MKHGNVSRQSVQKKTDGQYQNSSLLRGLCERRRDPQLQVKGVAFCSFAAICSQNNNLLGAWQRFESVWYLIPSGCQAAHHMQYLRTLVSGPRLKLMVSVSAERTTSTSRGRRFDGCNVLCTQGMLTFLERCFASLRPQRGACGSTLTSRAQSFLAFRRLVP